MTSKEYQSQYGSAKDGKSSKGAPKPTANAMTRQVLAIINMQPQCYATRVNTTGTYDEKKGVWRTTSMDKGIADIVGCARGHFIAVEIKAGADKQSEEQKRWQQLVENARGMYFICRDVSEFASQFYEALQNIKKEQAK